MSFKTHYTYDAKIIKVVDGDTVDATVDLGFDTFQNMRLRLYGIDTKELTSKDGNDRMLAMEAKQYVIDAILNKDVLLQTFKKDKYGRYLAIIYLDESMRDSLNNNLIEEGLAVPYFGGTKETADNATV